MIELLVVNKPGHINKDEVTAIKESPAVWGRKEDIHQWVREGRNLNRFPGVHQVIRADMTMFEARHYLEQWTELPDVIDPDDTGDRVLIKPRRRLVEMDRLFQAGAVNDPDGVPRLTKRQMQTLVRDQKTQTLEREP